MRHKVDSALANNSRRIFFPFPFTLFSANAIYLNRLCDKMKRFHFPLQRVEWLACWLSR